MNISLIPQPRRLTLQSGTFALPQNPTIHITDPRLHPAAQLAAQILPIHQSTNAPASSAPTLAPHRACSGAGLTLSHRASLHPEGYRLTIRPSGIELLAKTPQGATYGLETLRQLLAQAPAPHRNPNRSPLPSTQHKAQSTPPHNSIRLPCLRIDDWPAFPLRGVYYDVTRGRVPKTSRLIEQADLLSRFKINHLQHYVEHTYRFKAHPLIGRGASPLTAADFRQLDATCRARFIELVPSLASFGHMATVLHHKPYRHLAEDLGINQYEDPDAGKMAEARQRRAWSIAPANPGTYKFLDSLFSEFLPNFSSRQFNACCDETYDLALGQSYQLARRIGKGPLYLNHLLKLRRLARRHGKRIMFWGDIIHHYPDLIPKIPRDVTVLDWGYDHRTNFNRVAAFRKAGIPFIACPGTSSWVSLFPRLHEATASIHGYTRAALRHHAHGILNTDWGDRGHFNFMEFSWHGFLYGAEQAWNPNADHTSFTKRFARVFLGSSAPGLPRAIDALGDIAHLATDAHYQSIWYHIYFAPPASPLFAGPTFQGFQSLKGRIRPGPFTLNAALGHRTLKKLAAIRTVLESSMATGRANPPGEPSSPKDPHAILPYWLFAADTLAHAARKLIVLAPDGKNSPHARKSLRTEMRTLQNRFTRLWLARNRPSEIAITLRAYQTAMQGL